MIRVYAREGDGFGRAREPWAEASDVATSSLLEGLELPLEGVFREPPDTTQGGLKTALYWAVGVAGAA